MNQFKKAIRNLSGGDGSAANKHVAAQSFDVQNGDGIANIAAKTAKDIKINANLEDGGESGKVRDLCSKCKNVPECIDDKILWLGCHFCPDTWFCYPCANMKRKGDIAASGRPDLLWACPECVDGIESEGLTAYVISKVQPKEAGPERDQNDLLLKLDEFKSSIEEKITSLETNIKGSFEATLGVELNSLSNDLTTKMDLSNDEIHEKVVDSVKANMDSSVKENYNLEEGFTLLKDEVSKKVELSIEHGMARAWSSALFGDDDFPELGEGWKEVVARKKQKMLPQVIKQSVADSYREVSETEKRERNIILYRVPELHTDNENDRKKEDEELVGDLLTQIQVPAEAIKITRLGQYDPKKAAEKSRPIKIELTDSETRNKIMANANKLRDAPENLKKISLSYDMCEEHRTQAQKLYESAKDQTKKSADLIFKVRGLPGKMEIKSFPKV